MNRLFLACLTATAFSATTPCQSVIFFGAVPPQVQSGLRELLGPGYHVSFDDNLTDAFRRPIYNILGQPRGTPGWNARILDLSPLDWTAWEQNVDTFVTQGKQEVGTYHLPNKTTYLLVPRVDSSSGKILRTEYIPLLRQIARESNCGVIDLNDPAFQSGNPNEDEIRKLYVSLAKVQRNPGTWQVVRVSSEQSDEGPAKNAIDNNPDTYWHTRYDPHPTKVPHEIVIDLGKNETLAGFSYLARQDGGVNGRVKDFEVYLGDDPEHWAAPVLKGTLQNSMNEQRLLFPHPATGRYLRFRALSEVNGNIWTSVAELGVLPSGNSK